MPSLDDMVQNDSPSATQINVPDALELGHWPSDWFNDGVQSRSRRILVKDWT
jgi:hypothetical protein